MVGSLEAPQPPPKLTSTVLIKSVTNGADDSQENALTAGLDSLGGEGGLPRDGSGHAGGRANITLDVLEIGEPADQVEGAEGFPDVTGIGGKIGQWIAGFDGTAVAAVELANFTRHGRADFEIADAGDEGPGVHIIAQLQPVPECARSCRVDGERTQHGGQ